MILVTFITTLMVSLVAIIVWRLPIILVATAFLIFGAFEGMYLSAALTKVPEGAWFTLVLAVTLSSIFILWRFGKENQWRAEASDRILLSHLMTPDEGETEGERMKVGSDGSYSLRLTPAFGGAVISPIHGMGIFFDKTGSATCTPVVFTHFVQKFQAAPAIVVFFHIRALSAPTVPIDDRFTVSRTVVSTNPTPGVHSFYRITLRHGYMDTAITSDLGELLFEQLCRFVTREASSSAAKPPSAPLHNATNLISASSCTAVVPSEPESLSACAHVSPPDLAQQQVQQLELAYRSQVVYVVGKEQMRVREDCGLLGWTRRIVLSMFLWLRENTGTRVRNMNVDVDKLVEIGFVKVV